MYINSHFIYIIDGGNNTLPGNSNWFEWQWPTTGEFAGCIRARDIPGIGDWNTFTSIQLDKFRKKDISKPTPQVSIHTTPSSKWEVPMPNPSRIYQLIIYFYFLFC